MFVIIFRPGPPSLPVFKADINSTGHAPLLFLCTEQKTGRHFWVEHFINAELFKHFYDAQHVLLDIEKLTLSALDKMRESLRGMPEEKMPSIEGSIAVMPLAFGPVAVAYQIQAD